MTGAVRGSGVIVRKIEAWQLSRDASFFDATHTGRRPMPWDVVVLAITGENGVAGYATALGARSGLVRLTYLMDVIAPVVLGREVTDRESIWQELWNIDRHLAFFPVFSLVPSISHSGTWRPGQPGFLSFDTLVPVVPSCRCTRAACSRTAQTPTRMKRGTMSHAGSTRRRFILPARVSRETRLCIGMSGKPWEPVSP